MHFRPKNLKEVAQQAPTLEAWGSALAEFLDEVNATRKKGQPKALLELVSEEPPFLRDRFKQGETADAFGAALAEYIAESIFAPSPSWTRKDHRFLSDPWYPHSRIEDHPQLRIFIERDTPQAFRNHNVFIDENSLTRT
jgi:hypothetical protein